jgi:hypothetical protein
MKRRLALLGVLVATLVASVAAFTAEAPAAPAPTATSSLTVPITGTATNAAGEAVSFVGTFTLQRFTTSGGGLAAVGQLAGTLTNTVTGATQAVSPRQITLPVLDATGSCEILDLTLGPLDLDLLGLVVHLDTVHLNITAESGPGNLLGNLLCAVAGLLDANTSTNLLVTLLNRLLGLL